MNKAQHWEYEAFVNQLPFKFAHYFLTGLAVTRWHRWTAGIVWC